MSASEFEPIYIIAGLILCLFGWILYWVGLRLLGAACGGIAGAALSWFLFEHFQGAAEWELIVIALVGIVGAIAGFIVMAHAHYFVFFITGAMLGLAGAMTIERSYNDWYTRYIDTPALQLVFYGGAALVAGLLILALNRVIVMAVTSFAGTVLVAAGLPQQYAIWAFIPLVLGSFLLQMGILAAVGRPPAERVSDENEAE